MEIEDILEEDLIDIFSNGNCSAKDKATTHTEFKSDDVSHQNTLKINKQSNETETLDIDIGAITSADELLKLINGLLANKSIEITIKLKDN